MTFGNSLQKPGLISMNRLKAYRQYISVAKPPAAQKVIFLNFIKSS